MIFIVREAVRGQAAELEAAVRGVDAVSAELSSCIIYILHYIIYIYD